MTKEKEAIKAVKDVIKALKNSDDAFIVGIKLEHYVKLMGGYNKLTPDRIMFLSYCMDKWLDLII